MDVNTVVRTERPRLERSVMIAADDASEHSQWISGDKLLKKDFQELPCLWGKVLPKVGLAILGGSSDCGKSTLLRQLAIAVCKGDRSFLNAPLKTTHQRACFVSTEDDENAIAIGLKRQLKNEKNSDFVSKLQFLFDEERIIKEVDSYLNDNPCDLIILDSWGDIFQGNPNSFTEVRHALSPWKKLASKHQCLVVVIHHTIKNSEKFNPDKNRLNGSQALEAKVRCFLELRLGSNPNDRILSVVKCNHLSEEVKQKSIVLNLDKGSLLFNNTGEIMNRNSLLNQTTKKYENKEEIIEEARKLRNEQSLSFSELRNKMIEKYGEEKTPGLTWFKENCNKLKGDDKDVS